MNFFSVFAVRISAYPRDTKKAKHKTRLKAIKINEKRRGRQEGEETNTEIDENGCFFTAKP